MTAPTRKLLRRKPVKKIPQPADVAYPELEAILARLDVIKKQIRALEQEHGIRQAQALDFMKRRGLDTYTRGPINATPVFPMGEEVDWDGIHKALDAKDKTLWKRILGDPQPVKAKLEALIELGDVDSEIIDEHVKEKPIKPHVKLSERKS